MLQSGGVVVLLVFFGELFQKLVVIGEAAAVAAGEQARFDAVARGKLLHGGVKSVLLPLQGGGFGGMYPLEQRRFIMVERVKLGGALAEQHTTEHKAQRLGALRLQPKADQRGQRLGFGRGKHRFAVQQHTLHAARPQGLAHEAALIMGAHQHGNLPRLQRRAIIIQAAFGGFCQRSGDFVGTIFGGAAAQSVFFQDLRIVINPAHLNGRARRR